MFLGKIKDKPTIEISKILHFWQFFSKFGIFFFKMRFSPKIVQKTLKKWCARVSLGLEDGFIEF